MGVEMFAAVLRSLLDSDVGRQTLGKLADGQGTATADGLAWLRAQELLAGHQGAGRSSMRWPASRDVARLDDMSADGHLRVLLDHDCDVIVEVFDGSSFAAVEFCNPGGGGGGQSSRTRQALIELMRAIEADNVDRPARAHRSIGHAAANAGR